MEPNQHELYEYARDRIRQKKRLFQHFIVFVIGCVFLFAANHLLSYHDETNWWIWVASLWCCLFVFHVIKVLITDSFMNKKLGTRTDRQTHAQTNQKNRTT